MTHNEFEVEYVTWINTAPEPTARERLEKIWHERIRKIGTYVSRRTVEQPAYTHWPVSDIGTLPSQALAKVLRDQAACRRDPSRSYVPFPVATPDGAHLSHVWNIRKGPPVVIDPVSGTW